MRASLTLLFLKLALITCLGAQTGQPVPPAHVPGDSSTYARAMTRYYGADYGAARALLFRAAREYEDAGQLDSAAAALMHYGDTYVNVRALQALEVAYADTLAPWLERLGTPLARAFVPALRAEISYWSFEWTDALSAYREAFALMDTTSALALPFAASNRRSIGYLQIANPGPDSTVYYGQWSLRLAERAGGPCSRDRGYAHLGLANFYQLLPDIDVAIVHLQYAVAALDDALPPDHPSRASLYSQLADMEADRGRFDDALTATRRAFDHLRDDDPATGYGVAAEYAALLHYLGLYDEALYWDRRSLAYARAGFGADNAFLAAPSLSAAVAASYAGDTALAAGLMDSALLILDRHPAETDFVRPDYHAARGTNALARGDYDVARDAFLESLRIIRAREDADGLMLRTGLHNLINVYLQRAELDSAAAYYARLEAVLAEAEDVPGTSVNSMQHRRLGAELAVAGGDFARARDVLAELYGEVSSSSGRGGYLSLSFDLADAAARLADSSGRTADGALLLDYATLVERAIDEEYAFLGAERWDEGFTESLRRVFTAAAFATAERAAAATGPRGR